MYEPKIYKISEKEIGEIKGALLAAHSIVWYFYTPPGQMHVNSTPSRTTGSETLQKLASALKLLE